MKKNILVLLLLSCFLVFQGTAASTVHAQKTISMDFKSVDIQILIKFISEVTGKNFIVDKRVGGRVTIYSPTKISVDEAYKVFESVLNVNGFTVVADGSSYKILPSSIGRNMNLPTVVAGEKSNALGNEMITQIIPLQNSSVSELSQVVTGLLGSQGVVNVYKPANTLIVTSTAANIKRALSVIEEVDKSQYALKSKSIALDNGDATQVATSISKVMTAKLKDQEKKGRQGLALVVGDERTNSLFVLADETDMKTVEFMAAALDVPTPKGKGSIHLYNLTNADAEDMAKVLTSLISGQQTKKKENQVVTGDVKIVADKATNSLVITARPDDYDHMKQIIEKMDVRRKQVFIEALLMEVSSTANFQFGVNWAIPANTGQITLYGASNFSGSAGGLSLTELAGTTAGLVGFPGGASIGALVSDVFTLGGKSYSMQSLINVAETDSRFKILSTPQLLTLDNQEAKVDVVENLPFTKENVTSNASDRDYDSQQIEYRDVGVKLQVTPQIGIANTVRLKVHQEVSRVISTTAEAGNGNTVLAPTTRRREVDTVIQMQDSQTAVIAGLLGEDEEYNETRVPGLGDIPILGWLFKYKQKKKVKTNLFVFLTPRIVDTYEESTELFHEKRQIMHELEYGADGLGKPILSAPKNFSPQLVSR